MPPKMGQFQTGAGRVGSLWTTHHFCPSRYRSPGFHVQSWYDEVKDYTYPYPHECNPWCPERCSGAMCTHYTQVIWGEALSLCLRPGECVCKCECCSAYYLRPLL